MADLAHITTPAKSRDSQQAASCVLGLSVVLSGRDPDKLLWGSGRGLRVPFGKSCWSATPGQTLAVAKKPEPVDEY